MTKQFATVGEAIAAREARLEAERLNRSKAGRQHMNVREAHKPVKPLSPKDAAAKYASRRRTGKTERDRRNGAHQRAAARRQARAQWVQETRSKVYNNVSSVPTFPV